MQCFVVYDFFVLLQMGKGLIIEYPGALWFFFPSKLFFLFISKIKKNIFSLVDLFFYMCGQNKLFWSTVC